MEIMMYLLALTIKTQPGAFCGQPEAYQSQPCSLETVICPEEDPEWLIKTYSKNIETALKIAKCESQLGKYPKNWQGSSATGLFQFIPKTWNAYCGGDINNNLDQIRCFDELYPNHKNWWKCR